MIGDNTPSKGWLAGQECWKYSRTVRTETQKEAVAIAKQIAKNQQAECITRGRNGQIRVRDSYGNDSDPPKGQISDFSTARVPGTLWGNFMLFWL